MRKFFGAIDELVTFFLVIVPTVLTMIIVGPLMLYACFEAFQNLHYKPTLAEADAERAAVGKWPHVIGHLDELDINAQQYRSSRGVSHWDYFPTARYSYTVNSLEYKGTGIVNSFVDDDRNKYQSHDESEPLEKTKARLAQFLPADTPVEKRMVGEHDAVYVFHPNTDVNVFFDPKNPGTAVLDNQLPPLTWWQYYRDDVAGGIFCGLIGLLFTGMTIGVSISAWKHKQRARSTRIPAVSPKASWKMPPPIPADKQWQVEKKIS
jgi:hypothetical protein